MFTVDEENNKKLVDEGKPECYRCGCSGLPMKWEIAELPYEIVVRSQRV